MKLLPALVMLLVLAVGCKSEKDTEPMIDTTKAPTSEVPHDSAVIVLNASDSTNAFDLLKSTHLVDFQASAMGVFVKGIDSIYGSTDAYWVYSVNDSLPQIAADKFTVRPGDVVRWHLRKARE